LLPDDTWLSQLQITGQEIVLNGETGTSLSLVRLLDKSALLEEANFKSPLTKSRNNIERFQLAAKIRQSDIATIMAQQRAAEASQAKSKPKVSGLGGRR
jgi:Tfp pilus assembly protein PilN